MSVNNIEKIKCPKCGVLGEAVIYSSINASTNPDMRDNVLNSSIFKWQCAECGTEILITYPCLYHDMDHKFMVWLHPQGEIPYKMDDLLENHASEYELRIVKKPIEFIEKINIFERCLDDGAVEISKRAIASQYGRTHDKKMSLEIVFHEMDDNGDFVYFIIDELSQVHSEVIGASLYIEVFKDLKAKKLIKDQGFIKIDQDWASEMIGKL